MKYPDVDVGKVFHLNKMLINKSFRRFWIQTKDFRIMCSEYGFNLNKPRADILIIPGLSEFIERRNSDINDKSTINIYDKELHYIGVDARDMDKGNRFSIF